MTAITKNTLNRLYDEYVRTGVNDWQSIETPVGKQLASMGLVAENILGEFKLTDQGIAYAQS